MRRVATSCFLLCVLVSGCVLFPDQARFRGLRVHEIRVLETKGLDRTQVNISSEPLLGGTKQSHYEIESLDGEMRFQFSSPLLVTTTWRGERSVGFSADVKNLCGESVLVFAPKLDSEEIRYARVYSISADSRSLRHEGERVEEGVRVSPGEILSFVYSYDPQRITGRSVIWEFQTESGQRVKMRISFTRG